MLWVVVQYTDAHAVWYALGSELVYDVEESKFAWEEDVWNFADKDYKEHISYTPTQKRIIVFKMVKQIDINLFAIKVHTEIGQDHVKAEAKSLGQ